MRMENTMKFEKVGFAGRVKSMLKVDFRRMFKSKLFYILIACALVMPILMTVMMAMMDGSVSVDPQTGVETVMQGPENTWQNIGTLPGGEAMGGNEIFMMCNINMVFMLVAVFICLFISGPSMMLSSPVWGLTETEPSIIVIITVMRMGITRAEAMRM